jgi:sigma-B regulation protein RsbU (phosphoserine phosphatase)
VTGEGPRKRRFLSLEVRIAALTSLVLVVVSATVFVELTTREHAKLIASKTSAASMLTQLLATELATAIDFGDMDDVSARLGHLKANPDIVSAAVWTNPKLPPVASWERPDAPRMGAPGPSDPDGAVESAEWLESTRSIAGPRGTALARVRVIFTLRPENEASRTSRRQLFLWTAGAAALTSLLLALLARRFVVGPLRRVVDAAGALAAGNVAVRVQASSNDEIGDLAQAFNLMGAAVAFREERLKKEIDLAQHIQTSILPRSLAVPGLELAATMRPTAEVGGDYYDVLPVEGGCWIGIGDVAGHGLDAGLVMLMTQSIVAALVGRDPSAPPRDVVAVLNEVLFDNIRNRLRRDDHATLMLLHYERNGKLTFAGAHEDIIVFRAATGRCETVETPGTWVGGRRDIRAGTVDTRIELAQGDVMLLYTDGVIEMRNAAGEQFGVERLCAELERLHASSVEAIQDGLLGILSKWGVADDDVTVMVARYTGPDGAAVS